MKLVKKLTKKKLIKVANGSIAILLSFILTGILSFASLIVETIRYQEALQQLEDSTINSALSVLAYYDSDLASRFGLYGVDSESKSITADTFVDYLKFNSDEEESGVYSGTSLVQLYNVDSGTYELSYDLANYQVLKRQMLEYEKYRGPINVAEDLLDVDKLLKKLKEDIAEAIPGLEKMLTICDSVADIVDALEKLYCLYKDVEQLQLTINSGGEDGAGEKINNLIGEGWEWVEGLVSDKEWPSHDPSYIEAYETFKEAINNKVEYMKKNPAPEDPGPKPDVDIGTLLAEYENAKALLEEVEIIHELFVRAEDIGYCDTNGIVNSTKKISDIIYGDVTEELIEPYNLDKNSSRETFFTEINSRIGSLLGTDYMMEKITTESLGETIIDLNAKLNELNADVQAKELAYQTANSALNTWNIKNNALVTYNETISTYNDAIDAAKTSLIAVIGVVSGELNSYKGSIEAITKAFDSAADALETIQEVNAGDHVESEKEGTNIFTKLQEQYIALEVNKPIHGIEFLTLQKQKLEALNVENITESYVFANEFNTGKLLHDSEYYMTKTQATAFCAEIAAYDLFETLTDYLSIFSAMWDLISVMQPFPSIYNWDCVVELNESTTSILPSTINGGAGTSESVNTSDMAEITTQLNEAKNLLGTAYESDINLVDPNIRIEEAEYTQEVSARITRLTNNLSSFVSNGTVGSLMTGGMTFFITIIMNFYSIVTTLIEIIEDIIFIAQNFEKAIEVILSSLGENLLLNQYAVTMFPNRTTEGNSGISGYSGASRTWTPDNTLSVQTFSGAQVEYVIGGSYSEISNQETCFWTIFMIRVLNNMVTILTDAEVMEIIGACNILAPLVYILWVYLESNIDCNLLVSGKEVPLIKTEIILSPTTLIDNITHLTKVFDSIDEDTEEQYSYAAMKIDYITAELFKTDGLCKMKYENYLWFFMLFVPNETKVMRMADLIQMEMRYKKFSSGTTFELKNVHTYVRCESKATLNTILPVISLGNNTFDGEIDLRSVKYVGY